MQTADIQNLEHPQKRVIFLCGDNIFDKISEDFLGGDNIFDKISESIGEYCVSTIPVWIRLCAMRCDWYLVAKPHISHK